MSQWNIDHRTGRRVLFGWADAEPGQVMTLPRELLYDPSLRHIVQRPIEEFAQLRVLPPLARIGPQMLEAPLKLFTPRPEGHFVEVLAVFERPKRSAILWVDVLTPGAGANGSTRVAIDYRPPKDPSSKSVWWLALLYIDSIRSVPQD